MSILIKGMKMPQNCCECPLTYYEDASCLFTGIVALSIGRQAACPLVEVPPHGRLIDADVLSQIYRFDDYGKAVVDCEDMDNAPTIIEAEVDDEDKTM